jgi:Uma2 family endonuclease
MSCAVLFEEQLRIPAINSLKDFRKWLRADDFPERGRIDYIAGQIEVNMSPEDLFTHGSLKTEIASTIHTRVRKLEGGQVFIDSSRVTCPAADLSVEPDVVYLSHDTVETGLVKFVPRASEAPDRYIEIEGPPDLIVEIVSDSSVGKDTKRLPQKYFEAGVTELWLIDARGKSLSFAIHTRGRRGFVAVATDKKGFIHSAVLQASYLLERRRDRKGWPLYELHERLTEEKGKR